MPRLFPGTGEPAIIQLRDTIAVRSEAVARVRVDHEIGWHGFFYLSNRILDCAMIRDTVFQRVDPTLASYVLADSTDARKRMLVLRIRDGSAVIDWRKDGMPVLIWAGNYPILITGTKVAVAFDSATQAGWMYVREGTVVAGDQPVRAGTLLTFDGERVTPISPSPRVDPGIDFYSRDIFRTAFVKPRVLYGTGIAVAGLTTLYVIEHRKKHGGNNSVLGILIPW